MSGPGAMGYRPQMANNSRPVVKVDREGRVVARYLSILEAAKANYMAKESVRNRCLGIVKKEYDENGHTFRFDEVTYGQRK